jgi:hypothetical protein
MIGLACWFAACGKLQLLVVNPISDGARAWVCRRLYQLRSLRTLRILDRISMRTAA